MTVPITGHFVRIHAGTWTGPDLLVADCTSLDQEAVQCINGDDGGTWAPVDQIEVSGSVYGLTLTGPLVIWGAAGHLETSGSSRFTCGWGDFPQLSPQHAGRSRAIKSSFTTARTIPWNQWVPHANAAGALDGMMQAQASSTQQYGSSVIQPTIIVAPLEVHCGGTLSGVTISFAVGVPHATLPTLPKARVLRCDVNGNTTPMTSVAAGADAQGFYSLPTPTSATAYYNDGQVQQWTVPCDTDNVVDTSQYFYVVQVVEEQTGSPALVLPAVDLVSNSQIFTTFNGLGGLMVDGVALVAGMRLLLKDQVDPTQNGIWQVPALTAGSSVVGFWFRPNDMPLGATVPVGLQVPAKLTGDGLGGSTFVMSSGSSAPVVGGGVLQWQASTVYALAEQVIPGIPNGFCYQVTTAGTSAAIGSEPVWPTTIGVMVTDNSVVWTCFTTDTGDGMYFSPIGLPRGTTPPVWQATTAYVGGDVISPTTANGYVFRADIGSGTSGSVEPSWPTTPGGHVADGGQTWTALLDTYSQFTPPVVQGNVWNDLTALMVDISSLAFQ